MPSTTRRPRMRLRSALTAGLALLGLALIGPGAARPAAADEVKVALTPFAPYMIEKPAAGEGPGFVSEIIAEALKRGGHTVSYSFVPFVRAIDVVRQGQAQATISAVNSGERAQWFLFSDSMARISVGAFVKAGYAGPPLTSWDAIGKSGMRVVAIRSYAFLPAMRAAGVAFDEINGMDQGLNLAARSEPPAIFINFAEPTVYEIGHKADLANALKPFVVSRSGYYFAVDRTLANAPALIDAFNAGLKAMKDDGSYAKIMAKYPSATVE